jgi:geranylgeranyl pyrophosphate synthase
MAAAFDIFDDIIDKSEDKHSIPTVYGKFGTDIAILLGNAFLIEGFNLFVESAAILPEETRKKALGAYKKLLFEVGNAHALEVGLKHEVNVDPDANLKVIEMKAAGIEADVYLGALFGRGTEAEVEASAKIGRILGILITLREEFVDVFELEELRQRIATQNLPLPLLFALNDQNAKKNIEEILLKPKITREDIDTLVDLTLEAEPVKNLKKKMQLLMKKGSSLCYDLSSLKLQRVFQVLLQFMLEDL